MPGINSGLLLLELLLSFFFRPEAVIAVIADIGITGAITPTSAYICTRIWPQREGARHPRGLLPLASPAVADDCHVPW